MRMRRKRNLDERILACGEYVIKAEIRDRNMQRAVLEKEYLPLSEIFGNEHPVVLEIGSGKGLFACELARRHPEWNVLALEMISNVVIVGAERAKAEGIPNVRFFISRAECIEKYLPPHSVTRLYLNFSTPLPKDGYAKQRLTHERFLRRYASVLTEDGVIEQKTDNVPFFEFSLAQYEACGFTLTHKTYDLHAENPEDNIVTEHEAMFSAKGIPICFVEARMGK